MRQRLTKEQHDAILRAYEAGDTVSSICKRFDVSPSYPSQLAQRAGLTPRREHRPRTRKTQPTAVEKPATAKRFTPPRSRLLPRASAGSAVFAKPKAKPKQEPAPVVITVSIAEVKRLFALGRRSTEIAAMLRCPYREVSAALAIV